MNLSTRFSRGLGSSQNVAGIADVDFHGLGGLLEVSGEYSAPMLKKLNVILWGRVGILGSRGKGEATTRYVASDPTARINPIDTDQSVRFFRHTFTGGVALEARF